MTEPIAYLWQLTSDGQVQARQLVFDELTAEGLVAAYGGTVTPLYGPLPTAPEPEAWLFKCRKPGLGSIYASVDENDTLHWPIDQWKSVEKFPLYLHPSPALDPMAIAEAVFAACEKEEGPIYGVDLAAIVARLS